MLDVLYRVGHAGMASGFSTNGKGFTGYLSNVDEDFYSVATLSTHQIRYRKGVLLSVGATLTDESDGGTYRVTKIRSINSGEHVADLVRMAA